MSIPTVTTHFPLSEDVVLITESDKIDGEILDTYCIIEGRFCIGGSKRQEFADKLSALIEEYRI